MKLTYRTIPYDDDNDIQGIDTEITESGGNPGNDAQNRAQWDDNCPWNEWYSAEDPIKGTLCPGFFFIHLFSVLCGCVNFSFKMMSGMIFKVSPSKHVTVCMLK